MQDELDAQVPNWQRIDSAYSGALWVTPGTIPDQSILYDGLIVAERETGKVWRAQKNALGNFEQKWIKYPWLISATRSDAVFGNGVADHEWGFSGVDAAMCINASIADIESTRIIMPIDAIYTIRCRVGWSNGGNYRSLKLAIDGVVDTNNTETIVGSWPEFPYPQNNLNMTRKMFKGQTLCMGLWQNHTDSNVALDARMEVAVLRPL
jgi:hypothetical protein